jgi:hypothetical protein
MKRRLQSVCKACKKKFDRAYNERTKDKRREWTRAIRNRNGRLFYEYMKGKKCEWPEGCEVSDPDMLTCDHRDPSQKKRAVSSMVRGNYSWKTIMAEVAKCRILCSNHHHKHTIQQFGYKAWLKESDAQISH